MNLQDLTPIGFLLLILYIIVKDLVVPLTKKLISNHKEKPLDLSPNPINIDRFYQEFKDFKEAQCKWNDKQEERWEKHDERIDKLEGRKR